MTNDELQALEALERAAMPGPWHTGAPDQDVDVSHVMAPGFPSDEIATVYQDGSASVARFIAEARNALPGLIAEVRRLRAERDAAIARAYEAERRVMELDQACTVLGAELDVSLSDWASRDMEFAQAIAKITELQTTNAQLSLDAQEAVVRAEKAEKEATDLRAWKAETEEKALQARVDLQRNLTENREEVQRAVDGETFLQTTQRLMTERKLSFYAAQNLATKLRRGKR